MQAEEKNAAEMLPMIVENPPASNAFHDTEEKKFVADILVSCFTYLALFCRLQWNNHLCFFIYVQNSSEKTSKKTWNTITRPIRVLDPWNMRDYDNDKVTLEKDTRSDIPDIDTKKYHVHVDTPLGEFVYAIRLIIGLSQKKPIFVFFKNTEPPACALMSAIDEENKDEDGFLHMTYSGEEKNVNESSRSGSFELVGSCSKLDNPLERKQAEENNPDPIPMIVENTAASSDIPGIEEQKDFVKRFKDRTCLEAGELREKRPNYVPVTVEKDARSDIPDIDMKKSSLSIKKPIFVFFKNTEPPTGALMGAIDEENKDEDGFLHITYSGEERLCGSSGGQECP
ncbi:hypothetical protein GBA52_022052 [Prunus armeniaca]|nr:hypothetical protein GBA52_022052 [Prunus armeniaca]